MDYVKYVLGVIGVSSYLIHGQACGSETVATCEGEHLYRLTIKEHDKALKENLACMLVSNAGIFFRSATKPDYTFVPEDGSPSDDSFGPGLYRAYVNDDPILYKNTPVRVRMSGDSYQIGAPDSLGIVATKINSSVIPAVSNWHSPFNEASSHAYPSLKSRVVSTFGTNRTSFHIRHLHTGVDLAGNPSEAVYPIAAGIVEFVSYWDFEGTVVIRHRTPSGRIMMSKYVHVMNPKVHAGDVVNHNTMLARLFTKTVFKKSGFQHLHLHLEVRKDYSDYGHASTHSFTTNDLYRCCIDPLIVISRKP